MNKLLEWYLNFNLSILDAKKTLIIWGDYFAISS